MGFLAEVCRGKQGGAISLLPESIRRQPKGNDSGLLSMHQPGTAVCSPKSSIMSEKFLTYEDDNGPLFFEPCNSEKEERLTCVHPGALSFTAQLAPQSFG